MDYLTAQGEKVGVLKSPSLPSFLHQALLKTSLPETVKKIAVLDRTKESGSVGEPLYVDVRTACAEEGKNFDVLVGGRYGLGSKEFTPSMVKAVF